MNVAYRCSHCQSVASTDIAEDAAEFACTHCGAKFQSPAKAVQGGHITQCLVCPCKELYIRKDFSQNLGIGIVAAGAVISSVFWFYRMPLWTYGTLFATALIDVVLYITVGNVLQCYQCQAQYRGLKSLEEHGGFDLETHEKHRQQQIRLARAGAQMGTTPPRESL